MTYERRNGNSEAIVELLEDMLEDSKNEEFLDQVYFALGEVRWKTVVETNPSTCSRAAWRPMSTTIASSGKDT